MNKPKITEGEWAVKEHGFVVDENGSLIAELYCNENVEIINLLKNAKAISAVPEMIEALIASYLLIDDIPIDERGERHLRVYNKMADALEKAGCEL